MTSLLHDHLAFLYGEERAPALRARLEKLIAAYRLRIPARDGALTERDSILITYGDQIQSPNEKPLQTLNAFCRQNLRGVLSGIHILPFYPWTSDDGFSVVDYRRVDPALGGWDDLAAIQTHFRLMFDAVINHVSVESGWFRGFLRGEARFHDYFITVEGSPDLSRVVRPRALPLLTTFNTSEGERRVWTTFSADQVDLNYKNPEVLLEILEILLMYAERGADFIRLDAIAYLWKEAGTTCIHLPQAHRVVQLLRAVFDEAAPHVRLVTETNVPHRENVSYFGDGYNEAQLVYNFALPPLILHAFHTGEARILSNWARTLTLPSRETAFFNFLASHDGIGLNPARGILSDADIASLVERTLAHGGLISFKDDSDGSQSPYELNINYFDALSNPNADEPLDLQVDRFIAAHAIMLSLAGVPGIYFHSLFGSRGWPEGVKRSGRSRTINRQKCELAQLESELAGEGSLRSKVFRRLRQLLKARSGIPAFDPHGAQAVLNVHPSVFAVERLSPGGNSRAVCFHNAGGQEAVFDTNYNAGTDLLTRQPQRISTVSLAPYQTLWLEL